MEFFHKKTSFPFMATRKVWYTLSAILMIVSFASFIVRERNDHEDRRQRVPHLARGHEREVSLLVEEFHDDSLVRASADG